MSNSDHQQKTCFVASQIGEDGSPERIHSDWLFEEIITPVFEGCEQNYRIIRADKISEPGLIDTQIIEYILNSDIMIADLTNSNPNVLYEIGIRHAAYMPVIHMHLLGHRLPFDVSLFRSIPFQLYRPVDLRNARKLLAEAVKATETDAFKIDNPVTRAKRKIETRGVETETEKIRDSKLDDALRRISSLERQSSYFESPDRSVPIGLIGGTYDRMPSRVYSIDLKNRNDIDIQEVIEEYLQQLRIEGGARFERVGAEGNVLRVWFRNGIGRLMAASIVNSLSERGIELL